MILSSCVCAIHIIQLFALCLGIYCCTYSALILFVYYKYAFGVDASMGTMKACIDSMMRSDVDRSIVEMTHAVAILEMDRDGLVELLDIHVLSVSCVDPWYVVISEDHVHFMPRDCDCYFRINRGGFVEIMDSASTANCRFIGTAFLPTADVYILTRVKLTNL